MLPVLTALCQLPQILPHSHNGVAVQDMETCTPKTVQGKCVGAGLEPFELP